MFAVIGSLVMISNHYTLNGIKSRTVGDGQYGTARFATEKEIRETYAHVPYEPEQWRAGKHLPKEQGLVVGCKKKGNSISALVDSGDIHCLMIGAAGVGKTANFLYPNIEYACASGMSFLTTDTKGDLFRNYAGIAKEYYGYRISILDLRNPTRSDGNNILTLVNKYMDEYLKNPENLAAKARAEKYAKITAKTIICSEGASASSYGQNAFFYDAAEGLLTSVILLIPLFLKWGIRFEEVYEVPEQAAREVVYADRLELEEEIVRRSDFDEEDLWRGSVESGKLEEASFLGGKAHGETAKEKQHKAATRRLPLRTD